MSRDPKSVHRLRDAAIDTSTVCACAASLPARCPKDGCSGQDVPRRRSPGVEASSRHEELPHTPNPSLPGRSFPSGVRPREISQARTDRLEGDEPSAGAAPSYLQHQVDAPASRSVGPAPPQSIPRDQTAVAAGEANTGEVQIRVGILLMRDRSLLASAVGVALNLDPDLCVVAIEAMAIEGVGRLLIADPDIVIVDNVSMVGRLREDRPVLRVMVLDVNEDSEVALASIRAGAHACVSGNTSPVMLADKIKRVHAGEMLYETDTLLGLLRRSSMPRSVSPRRTAKLADRELEVLKMLALGWTSHEAADRLGITVNTFRTHVKNILSKLEARSKLEAVLIAIREGRIALPPDSV